MDRPRRYTTRGVNYSEPYVAKQSTTGRMPTTHSASPNMEFEHIDLDEVSAWTRRPRRPDPEWPIRRTLGDDGVHGGWSRIPDTPNSAKQPMFVVEKAPAAEYETATPPELEYNQNFLHPPTPLRDSFFSAQHNTSTLGPGDDNGDDNGDGHLRQDRRVSVTMDLDKTSRFGWWTLFLLLLNVLMVTLTSLYANGSTKALLQYKFFITSASNAIFILRLLTEVCALLLAALIVVVVEDLQWALASRPGGVSLLHFVGLDAGTGVWGLLRLLATADWRQKYSSLFRLIVICAIPVPGLVLMGDITTQLIFFPKTTYDVATGIAPFNASYISQIDESIATALLVQMGSPTWSDRDSWDMDPLGPAHGKCTKSLTDGSYVPCAEGHLLVGGVTSTTPQKDDLTMFPDTTAYVVPKARTLHLEYGEVHDLNRLYDNGTCYLIGSSSAASYWCTDTGSNQEFLFGSSYCPLSIQNTASCLNDTTWTKPLQLASSIFVYHRYGTVNYDRGNFSILSVSDLTPPIYDAIPLRDYMTALSAVVPGFANSSSRVGDNSALAIYAVTALPLNDNEVAKRISLGAVRKAMAVPLNYFHANYFAAQSVWELAAAPRDGLPADMYTTLSLAVTSHQVIAGRISRWLFGLLAGVLIAVCLATMIATARICSRRPQRCGYPTLDFAAVCAVKGGIPRPPSAGGGHRDTTAGAHGTSLSGLHRSLTSLGQKPRPFQVASRIKGEKVVLGQH